MFRTLFAAVGLLTNTAFSAPTLVEKPTPAVSTSGLLIESIGIETLGGVFTPLLQRGCKVPCSITQVFSTAEDGQSQIKVFVFRGNAKLAKDASTLGVYEVRGIPSQLRGVPQVAITFSVNSNEISLNAVDKKSNRALEIKRVEF